MGKEQVYEAAMAVMLLCQLGMLLVYNSVDKQRRRAWQAHDEVNRKLTAALARENRLYERLNEVCRDLSPFVFGGTTEKKGKNNNTLN